MVEGESIILLTLVKQASTAQRFSQRPHRREKNAQRRTHISVCLVAPALRDAKPSIRAIDWSDVRVAESDVDSTPFHPEPGRARRQRRRVLRG